MKRHFSEERGAEAEIPVKETFWWHGHREASQALAH